MSEALQTERSPASVESATAGQILSVLEQSDITMHTAKVVAEAIPHTAYQELTSIDQWVSWKRLPPLPTSKARKPRKVPVNPKNGDTAKVNDPLTWASFDAAYERAKRDRLAGVGFVLRRENDLILIDMDAVINDAGEMEPWAAEIVGFKETYCEISPSGNGLRMFARGTLDHAVAASDIGVEMYSEGRYGTVTGKRLPESPEYIAEAPKTVAALIARVEAMKGRREVGKEPLASPASAPEQSLSEREKALAAPAYSGDGNHAGGDERRWVEMALACIPSDDYRDWVLVGGALHDKFGADGRGLWDTWAAKSSKFDPAYQDQKWRELSASKATNRAGIGSIIHMARERGFTAWLHDCGPEVPQEYLKIAHDFIEKGPKPDNEDKAGGGADNVGGGLSDNCSGLKFYFDGEDATTPPPSLVKGLLPYEGVAMIAGQSGAGKTFIACYLAVMLASGKPFFGRKVAERVGVVIVAAEGAATIASRIHAAREDADFDGELLPIAWLKEVPDLSQKASITQLAGALKARSAYMQAKYGVRLGAVFIDTLNAAFTMQDENSNAEAGAIMRSLHWLSKETGALVLPIHHYGKTAETGPRGASAWRAGCDAVLSVLADRNQITGKVSNRSLALAKSRVGEEGEISAFSLRIVSQGFDSDGDEVTTCTVLPTEGEAATEKSKRQSRGEVAYLKALSVVTDKAEKVRPFEGDSLEVSAVDRETIRAEFYPSWPADGTAEQKSDTRRKAFNRAEQALRDRRKINVREIGGRQMVWPLEKDAIQKSGTPGQ